MQSAFTTPRPPAAITNPSVDETYDLRGLNLRDPDDTMGAGETPFTINSRMRARNNTDSQVANRSRMGSSRLSVPVGEVIDVQNVATVTGDVPFTNTVKIGQPWTAGATGRLTRLDIELDKTVGVTATGHILLRVYSDLSGVPGALIGEGSILSNAVTTSRVSLPAYFIDAPVITSGSVYWFIAVVQDNGVGPYNLSKTAASGARQITTDDIYPFTVRGTAVLGYSVRFKAYVSTDGGPQGFMLRYPSTASGQPNLIMMAQKGKLYSIPKSTGVTTLLESGMSPTNDINFDQINDLTIYCDGTRPAWYWDGTNAPGLLIGAPGTAPTNVIIWQNRVFLMINDNLVNYSNLNDPNTWDSVNFFYVPSPKSSDRMTGWEILNDNLTIFTHETKHIILGTNVTNFTRKEAEGSKGAVSQKAIVTDKKFIYFMADDGVIYKWNGASDVPISEKVQRELDGIVDKSKVRLDIYNNQLRVYYPETPDTVNTAMLLYDIQFDQWFKDTDRPVAGSTNLYLDNNELIEFSSVVGAVYYGEIQDSDLGKPIDWNYYTNYKSYGYKKRTGQSFGGGSAKKRIKRFRPVLRTQESDYTMLVGKDMDFANNPDMREYIVAGGGAKWGQFVWGDGTKWGKTEQVDSASGMSGRGKYIQYRFSRRGVETPVELYGYISAFKVGRQK